LSSMQALDDTGSISTRAWTRLLLATTALLVAAVAAFNALVDPTAQLGTGVLEPVAAGPRDRVAKATLLEGLLDAGDGQPRIVVLGSSRTKKLDPTWLGHAAGSGLNAAVVGGDLFEARVFAARIAQDRTGPNDEWGSEFPWLIVGIDVEQFRDSSLQGSGFLDVPQLADVARTEAAGSDGSLAGELDRLERLLLTWQITKASVASARSRARGGNPAATTGADEASADLDDFTATGVLADDARWSDPVVASRRARATPSAIERNVDELRGTYESNGARLDPDAVADLRALVAIVHDAGGPPPVLYITPGHPALDELDDLGRDERRLAVMQLLRDVAAAGPDAPQLRAYVSDCARCIDDDVTNWIDATHPSPLGMQQLARTLKERHLTVQQSAL
jgi:hypothetical protein